MVTNPIRTGKIGRSASFITFPRDEGRHSYAEREWWYFKGHSQADDGSRYSFVLCYLAPTSFENSEVNYFLSVVDEDRKICYRSIATNKAARCRYSELGLDLSYGSNWWRQGGELFTYEMHNEVSADMPISLDLSMMSLKTPLLPTKTEVIRIAGGYSYYYVQTHLDINGCVTVGNETKHVRGVGWIERQWGSWEWGLFGGWEWLGINLNSNTEIFVFLRLHPITRRYVQPLLFGIIANDSMAMLNGFEVHRLGYWRSKSGCLYPAGWRITAPQKRIELMLKPLLKDQEIIKGLWEGACAVTGTLDGKEVTGRAFAEHAYIPGSPFSIAPYYVAIKFLSRVRMLSLIRSLLRKRAF